MSRLTVNEAGTSGYTDEIILTPGDFTTAKGNTTTQVNFGVKEGDVIYGAALEVTEAFSSAVQVEVGTDANVDGTAADQNSLITLTDIDTVGVAANTGADIIAGAGPLVVAGDGNITIIADAALDGDTSGKFRVLLGIRRINA